VRSGCDGYETRRSAGNFRQEPSRCFYCVIDKPFDLAEGDGVVGAALMADEKRAQ
jgi:hypothetical protein